MTRERDEGDESGLEADQVSKCGVAEEGEVDFEGEKTAQMNSDEVNTEGEEDFEAKSGKRTGGGGTRKQKQHRKFLKSTTPVSETPLAMRTVYNTIALRLGKEKAES